MKRHFHLKYHLLLAIAGTLFISCGGSDGGDDPDPDPVVPAPAAATLIFPENNSECTEGEILNETQSRVTFQWNASQNTDTYQVSLRNLNTNGTSVATSSTPEVDLTLIRGVPYEWFVTSRANGTTATAESPRWRFYNAGPGIENYAPFPAEAIAPTRGATLPTASEVTLRWSGNDIDGDIASYHVYFGTADPPPLFEEGLTETTLDVTVASGQTYYWQVETEDSAGNRTNSELFVFQVE